MDEDQNASKDGDEDTTEDEDDKENDQPHLSWCCLDSS